MAESKVPDSGFIVIVKSIENGLKYLCVNVYNNEVVAKKELPFTDITFVTYIGIVHAVNKAIEACITNFSIYSNDLDAILLFDSAGASVKYNVSSELDKLENTYIEHSLKVIDKLESYNNFKRYDNYNSENERIKIRCLEEETYREVIKKLCI